MKSFLQISTVLVFTLFFFSVPVVIAQEIVGDEVCVVDEQEQQAEEQCEEETEVPVIEPLIKGAKNPETVAGTEAELANQTGVLGESTEVLAETGNNTEIITIVGIVVVLVVSIVSRTATTYKYRGK